jgi:drug/metabolite transporter (DMT)-like permease
MSTIGTKNRAVAMMATCAVLWSIAGIFIKYIPWHALEIAGGRSMVAAVIVYAFMLRTGMRFRLNRSSVLAGLMLASTFTLFVTANKLTSAANAIVLQFTSPVFIVLLSTLLFRQRFRRSDYAVVAVTVLGIVFCFYGQLSGGSLLGNCAGLLSGATCGAMFVVTGRADPESRMSGILLGHVFTAAISLPFFFLAPPALDGRSVLFVVILGVFQLGVPYLLYGLAVEHCPPLACCLIGVLEPLLNPLWVFLFYRENPGLASLIGGLLVVLTVTCWTVYNSRHAEKA